MSPDCSTCETSHKIVTASNLYELSLKRELDWLKEGNVIKIDDEGTVDYFKILKVNGEHIKLKRLTKDGVLL